MMATSSGGGKCACREAVSGCRVCRPKPSRAPRQHHPKAAVSLRFWRADLGPISMIIAGRRPWLSRAQITLPWVRHAGVTFQTSLRLRTRCWVSRYRACSVLAAVLGNPGSFLRSIKGAGHRGGKASPKRSDIARNHGFRCVITAKTCPEPADFCRGWT
jgi:hypothetical protein